MGIKFWNLPISLGLGQHPYPQPTMLLDNADNIWVLPDVWCIHVGPICKYLCPKTCLQKNSSCHHCPSQYMISHILFNTQHFSTWHIPLNPTTDTLTDSLFENSTLYIIQFFIIKIYTVLFLPSVIRLSFAPQPARGVTMGWLTMMNLMSYRKVL